MTENDRSRVWLWVLIGGSAFFLFVLAVFTLVYLSVRSGGDKEEIAWKGGKGKIAVVDVQGVILTPKDVVKHLKRFGDDNSIKAIILHVNSPGGGAAASEEMYRSVRRLRDEKKKLVVASIETVGASGGYYVASAASKVYANQSSVVGSIGVIAEWYTYADLLRWAKMKNVVIKTGEFKDTGNPAREMTPAERAYLQTLINDMKGQFVQAVAEGRKLKVEEVNAIADGRVWTGQQALGLKLIDQIGDFQTVVKETAKAAGISGEPTVVRAEKEKRTLLDLLLGDVSEWLPDKAKLMENNVGFYYLWK